MVYGVDPFNLHAQGERQLLVEKLEDIVVSVEELNVESSDITVFFIPVLTKYLDPKDNDIIVIIKGMFSRSERTPQVKQELADRVKAFLREEFPNAPLIEVMTESLIPGEGYSSSVL